MKFSLMGEFRNYLKPRKNSNLPLTIHLRLRHPLTVKETAMDDATRTEADRRFMAALEETGARDPRDFYRKALRGLKDVNPSGYQKAVGHYQEVLVPSIAEGEVEPLRAWRDYGRLIAEVTAPGRTLAIDETGRASPFHDEAPMDSLVIHLPEARGTRALLVSLPPTPSRAQRATYELLVAGKHRLPESA
jgi:hypothetical protein